MRSPLTLIIGLCAALAVSAPAAGDAPATPANLSDLASRLAAAYRAYPSNPTAVAAAIQNGGLSSRGDPAQLASAYGPCVVTGNVNLRQPFPPIYPKKSSQDAPYDISEAQLRSVIYIPPGFTYGKKPPLLLVAGTGDNACQTFQPNFGKLWQNVSFADPVYVNTPFNNLDDIQNNAEYVAYATNYISAISNNVNVSTLTWSQGSIDAQWAYKYWPSTRNVTSDLFSVSADFHGTVLVPVICPPAMPCAPGVLQQDYNSKFIQTLRNGGGDSAYVPTTQIHSIFDEIVEPQQDPIASAQINDARRVGTSNNQLQTICPVTSPAGAPNFGHESLLYNAISVNLAKDALTNKGPANAIRSLASLQCSQPIAPGLTLADALATEALIPIAGFNIETYPNKVTQEPPIKAYAQKDAPA